MSKFTKKVVFAAIVGLFVLAAVVYGLWSGFSRGEAAGVVGAEDYGQVSRRLRSVFPARTVAADAGSAEASGSGEGEAEEKGDGAGEEGEEPEPETEDDREEKLVDAFDELTDKWTEEDEKRPVTMKDIEGFGAAFRKIPKARREECVQRALNLIPDGNVMLLAGILMDKSNDAEILEAVYNDVLNRDEEVKKPILRQIYKDRSHPCWADTAWILDVTGELPASTGGAAAGDAEDPKE